MQLGFTLTEEMLFRDGQLINPSLADYKIPGFRDLPFVIENEAVASSEHGGPFGAKGVGESATFGVSPAIANAIDDAIGVRLTSLPLKPEAILRALRVRDGSPLPEER
jgi:CO/xanthine dehydrogenase Mo-binding subunit